MKYPAAAVLLLGLASTGCVVTVDSHSEITREEKRFPVSGVADVRVATFDGSIQVQSWDKAEVLVEIEKRGPNKEAVEGIQVTATQNGNVIEVEAKRPRTESLRGLVNRTAVARLIVTVPRSTGIRARSGDGSIRVEAITGRVELRTGDGSVRASDVSGELIVDTGDGSVTVTDLDGRLAVETGDGSVSVAGRLAAAKIHTGDGSIAFRAAAGSTMSENWELTTGDGTVSLYLPAEFNAEVDAHTGDGRITNDLDVEKGDGNERERARRSLKGRLGAGGKLLRIRSGDGSIRLKAN